MLLLHVFNPALKKLNHSCALRKKNRKTLTDIINGREVSKLSAELIMVTLFCFFKLLQMLLQLACLCESGAVDTLKHLVVGVASPVGARAGGQFERLDTACVGKMGTCAKLNKFALTVERNLFSLIGVLLDKLNFIRLALFFHHLDGLFRFKLKLFKRKTLFDNLLHFLFECFKHFGGKGNLRVKVIVEAIFNRRTDGKLRIRVKTLYRLR